MIAPALLATSPSGGPVWRIVESQEHAATRSITASAEEQSRLEALLEANKPAYLPGTERLHWLLKTPFRYPPLRHGSRFGSPYQPGILYASRELFTAMTEAAVYLWLFRGGPAEPGPLRQIEDSRTALRFNLAHPESSDLTRPALKRYRKRISDPGSYEFSQSLGDALRDAGAGMIWFRSARAGDGINCAVLDPKAINRRSRPRQEQWQFVLDASACWWGHPGRESFEIPYESVADASGRIPHPAL